MLGGRRVLEADVQGAPAMIHRLRYGHWPKWNFWIGMGGLATRTCKRCGRTEQVL